MRALHRVDTYAFLSPFPFPNVSVMTTSDTAERHVRTMQLLKEHGHTSVSRLSKEFGVSEVTIRKDLDALEERKLLVRTHGGAVLIDHYMYDLPFDEKSQQHVGEKKRIGRAAAERVEGGDTLILSAGSTTTQVARHLRDHKNLTVTTNSLHVAAELLNNFDMDMLLLGGIVHPATASVVGPFAEKMLQEYSFQKLFLGGDGFDVDFGLTTTNALEAHLNRMMIQSAQETIAVMDASKFGRRGLSLICGLNDVDTVITDNRISDETVQRLEEEAITVVIV